VFESIIQFSHHKNVFQWRNGCRRNSCLREALWPSSMGRWFDGRFILILLWCSVMVIEMLLKQVHVICSRLRRQLVQLLTWRVLRLIQTN